MSSLAKGPGKLGAQGVCLFTKSRAMINKPRFNIRVPIIIPIKGRGFINQGSGLS